MNSLRSVLDSTIAARFRFLNLSTLADEDTLLLLPLPEHCWRARVRFQAEQNTHKDLFAGSESRLAVMLAFVLVIRDGLGCWCTRMIHDNTA